MARVLVLGVATVDFVFSVQSFPQRAEKHRADDVQIVGGGMAGNAAVAVARLGGDAHLISRLGQDGIGDMIVDDLRTEGVDTTLVHQAKGGRSSFSSVYVDAAGERQIMNYRGAGLTTDVAWLNDLPRADAVLVDPRWVEGAVLLLDMARDWGVPGVVDGEAPIARELLDRASHVAFSRTGMGSLCDDSDLAKALQTVACELPGWACVTDGAQGVYFTGAAGIDHAPAFDVPVKDTLGAGDIWHGAFALALAEGQGEIAAMQFASAAAALKCTQFGGRAGCPDRAAVTKFLKERS